MEVTRLDRNSPTPLYAQIEDAIRNSIDGGEWASYDRIPSESALTELFGVSRMTVHGVLNTLVDDGVLYRVPGKGTFVAEQKISTLSPAYRGVREQLEQMGFEIRTELVRMRTRPATPAVCARLGVSRDADVHEIIRRRLVDDRPVSLHRSFIPARLASNLPEDDVLGEQLCVILERQYGLRAARTAEQLEAVAATSEEAALLAIAPRMPLLLLEDTIHDSTGTAFEYSKILFRGDRMKVHFEYGVED